MHARLDVGQVQIPTRRGNDWTQKYPGIAKAIAELPVTTAILMVNFAASSLTVGPPST